LINVETIRFESVASTARAFLVAEHFATLAERTLVSFLLGLCLLHVHASSCSNLCGAIVARVFSIA
jgi:hypothetical protein